MSKTRTMLRSVKQMLSQRLADALSVRSALAKQNPLNLISQINARENTRLKKVTLLHAAITDSVKQQSNQSIAQIGRILYAVSSVLLRKTDEAFEPDRCPKIDFSSLISLFRRYFAQCNDIRMLTRLEDFFRCKSLKKPIILVKLLAVLIDISKNFLSENIKSANQAITEKQIAQYHVGLRGATSNGLLDLQVEPTALRRSLKRINCPVIVMQPFCRSVSTQQLSLNPGQVRFGNLSAFRNKLYERWRWRSDKQNICADVGLQLISDPRVLPPKRCTAPIGLNIAGLQRKLEFWPTSNNHELVLTQNPKPRTSEIARKVRNIGAVWGNSRDRLLGSSAMNKRRVCNLQTQGGNCQLLTCCYGPMQVDQGAVSKLFLRRGRRHFCDNQLKQLLDRNRHTHRNIESFSLRAMCV